jgi:pilus assembly protein CpaD
MDIGSGDRIAIDGAGPSDAVRADVSAIIGRHGLMLSEAGAASTGGIAAGSVRVTLTRSTASVLGCPDWAGRSGGNPGNATSANYGCAINGNIAAMVADPRDLLEGVEGTSNTLVMTSNKAIAAYREQTVTGTEGPSQTATSED